MDLSYESISQEVGTVLKYQFRGIINKVAEIMGLSPNTVYDYADGRIKPSTAYLHAAVIATDGHPDVKKFLEPEGWTLVKKASVSPDKKTLAEECLDDLPCLADYHRILSDPTARRSDVVLAKEKVMREINENFAFWLLKRGER